MHKGFDEYLLKNGILNVETSKYISTLKLIISERLILLSEFLEYLLKSWIIPEPGLYWNFGGV